MEKKQEHKIFKISDADYEWLAEKTEMSFFAPKHK